MYRFKRIIKKKIQQKNLLSIFKILYFLHRKDAKRRILKKNPLKNYRVMVRLNPYHKHSVKLARHTDLLRRRKRLELQNKKRGVRILFSFFFFSVVFAFLGVVMIMWSVLLKHWCIHSLKKLPKHVFTSYNLTFRIIIISWYWLGCTFAH